MGVGYDVGGGFCVTIAGSDGDSRFYPVVFRALDGG